MEERLRCRRCSDVIGAYEPIFVHAEGEWRETSLLNEQFERPFGDCYHRACFQEAHGGRPAPPA